MRRTGKTKMTFVPSETPEGSSRDPDRLFPVDPHTRAIARALYERVVAAPIISPHGHVPAEWLAQDIPFDNATALLVSHDHYVTRLLHASVVDLADLGVGGKPVDPRAAWRIFASRIKIFAGTAAGYWLDHELHDTLGIDTVLNAETADLVYDAIQAKLDAPAF